MGNRDQNFWLLTSYRAAEKEQNDYQHEISDRSNTIMPYNGNARLWPDYGHRPMEHKEPKMVFLGFFIIAMKFPIHRL
jgi:hypothetical protein